jgi:toxin ParE1/3/4
VANDIFLPGALNELRRAARRYSRERPGLGDSFATEVRDAVDLVLAMPSAGSAYRAGTRRVMLKRFPYSVIYQPRPDLIIIVAIAHHRRAETYWLRRLRST